MKTLKNFIKEQTVVEAQNSLDPLFVELVDSFIDELENGDEESEFSIAGYVFSWRTDYADAIDGIIARCEDPDEDEYDDMDEQRFLVLPTFEYWIEENGEYPCNWDDEEKEYLYSKVLELGKKLKNSPLYNKSWQD